MLGFQAVGSTTMRCPGFSGRKTERHPCTQCRDVAVLDLRRSSAEFSLWECTLLVLISPFHSDQCQRKLNKHMTRLQALYHLSDALAEFGVSVPRILEKTNPDTAPHASSDGALLQQSVSIPERKVRRLASRIDRARQPITTAIRCGDAEQAVCIARSKAPEGYLAAKASGIAFWVSEDWIRPVIRNLQLSLPLGEFADLLFFVFQSPIQAKMRNVCRSIAIDSVHSFSQTPASGPEQLLREITDLTKTRPWARDLLQKAREELREADKLLRPVGLVTVVGHFAFSNEQEISFPLGYALVSSERTPVVTAVLQILFPADRCRVPPPHFHTVMSDMADNLRNAIVEAGFPRAAHRMCTWHVYRAMEHHAKKSPILATQLVRSIFKYMVFGPRRESPDTKSMSDETAVLMQTESDLLDRQLIDQLRTFLNDLIGAKDTEGRSTGHASIRYAQHLLNGPPIDRDVLNKFGQLVDQHRPRIRARAMFEPESESESDSDSESEVSPPPMDGTILLQILGFVAVQSEHGRQTKRSATEPPVYPAAVVKAIRGCLDRVEMLSVLDRCGLTLGHLRPMLPETSPLVNPRGAAIAHAFHQRLRAYFGGNLSMFKYRHEVAFLCQAYKDVSLMSIQADDPPEQINALLESCRPEDHCPDWTEFNAIACLIWMLLHRGPLDIVCMTEFGLGSELRLHPSDDPDSIFYVNPLEEGEPVARNMLQMFVLVEGTNIKLLTEPRRPPGRIRNLFSVPHITLDTFDWNNMVCSSFEHYMSCCEDPSLHGACQTDLDILAGLGNAWLEQHEFEEVLPDSMAYGFHLVSPAPRDGDREPQQSDDVFVPDLRLFDGTPERRKRQREQSEDDDQRADTIISAPLDVLAKLPLRESKETPRLLTRMGTDFKESVVRSALRSTLALYHAWATKESVTILRRINERRELPLMRWMFSFQTNRAEWEIATSLRAERHWIDRIPNRDSLQTIWHFSLRVEDVEQAAHSAYAIQQNSRWPQWSRLLPVERLAWQHAVISLWKEQLRCSGLEMISMCRLASFTGEMLSCLAWLEVFAPDCHHYLRTHMLNKGAEGSWSAGFYTIPLSSIEEAGVPVSAGSVRSWLRPTTNNALESLHKDIHNGVNRRKGSLSFAVLELPRVLQRIFMSRASNFRGHSYKGQWYEPREAGVIRWVEDRSREPLDLTGEIPVAADRDEYMEDLEEALGVAMGFEEDIDEDMGGGETTGLPLATQEEVDSMKAALDDAFHRGELTAICVQRLTAQVLPRSSRVLARSSSRKTQPRRWGE